MKLNGVMAGGVEVRATSISFGLKELKENDVADWEGPNESSKLGSDETGSPLTRLCIPARSAEPGKTGVALDVMAKLGREPATIVRAFALISSSLASLTFTFFACSCDFVDSSGGKSVGLKVKLKLEEGGSNLKSDF